MELLDGVPDWVIAVVVGIIIIGTVIGVVTADFRRRKNGKDES